MIQVRSLVFVALFYLWSTFIAVSMTPLFVCPRRWVMYGLTVYGHGICALLALICGIRVSWS